VPFKMEMEMRELDGCDQRVLEKETTSLLDKYWHQLVASTSNFGISVVAKEEKQFISDGRRFILPFQLECSKWKSSLIPFIREFYAHVASAAGGKNIRAHEMPTISTHSLLLYPLRLINAHAGFPLAR
ncbi:hypothetical protein PMAYCL1PPCAC_21159, partial [Pristionchus mayeri]